MHRRLWRARWLAYPWFVWSGCQPAGAPTSDAPLCPEIPLTGDAVAAGPTVCAAQRFTGGSGRPEDWWLANSMFRAIVRHPNASLSLAGIGGGSLVDVAPWGRTDAMFEAVPLVDGGWLFADDATWDDDSITVSGVLRALPYRPIPAEGERRDVTWRVEPGSPWLRFDGADGLWIHPSTEVTVVDGWLVGPRIVYGHDGTVAEDLGGALVIEGATGLLVSDLDSAWAERPGPSQRVAGAAPGADAVRMYRGDTLAVITEPDAVGNFDLSVPADVDSVRAYAAGRAPSPLTPPSAELAVNLGGRGSVTVGFAWPELRGGPVRMAWSTADGRTGDAVLPAEGATLDAGAGAFELQFSAGPAWHDRSLRVEIRPGEALTLPVRLLPAITPGTHALADLRWTPSQSRSVRASVLDRSGEAVGAGNAYILALGEDNVPLVDAWLNDRRFLQWTPGAALRSPDGWLVAAWPWTQNLREPAGGAPRAAALTPLDALALAWGGVATDRKVAVNLDWLRAVPADPVLLDPRPDFVWLDAPGPPPFAAWDPWFSWLDRLRFLLPVGDHTWLDVETPERFGPVELSRALNFGSYSTGTGPLLQISIDGVGPGGVLGEPPPPPTSTDTDPTETDPPHTDAANARASETATETDAETDAAGPPDSDTPSPTSTRTVLLDLQRGVAAIDRVTLWTAGVGEVQTWEIDDARWSTTVSLVPGVWTALIAWSTTTDDWAVTAPIWSYDAPVDAPNAANGRRSTPTPAPGDAEPRLAPPHPEMEAYHAR